MKLADLKKHPVYLQILLPFITLITLFRWAQIILVQRPLTTDEAQYYLWSQYLSLGYHSKPPLIAYLTRLSTSIFGGSLFGIKFFVPLSYAITSSFIFFATKKIANKDIALASAMSFFLSLGVSYSATILSTDPFMLLFWSMAFYYLIEALVEKNEKSWLFVGLGVGLSILSKYTGAFFLLSLAIYALLEKPSRQYFKSIYFFLSLLLIAAIIAPNIYWNLVLTKHSAFTHVLHTNIGTHKFGQTLHPVKLIEFIASQLALISPILTPIVLYGLFTKRTFTNGNTKLLWCFAFPIFFIMCLQALARVSYANWAVAMYVTGIPLAYYLLFQTHLYRRTLAMHFVLGFIFVMVFGFFDFAASYGYLNKGYLPKDFKRAIAWSRYSNQLMAYRQNITLFASNEPAYKVREAWAQSLYHGKFDLSRVYTWPNLPFESITSLNKEKGESFIYLTFDSSVPNKVLSCFSEKHLLQTLPLYKDKGAQRTLHVFKLKNFQGESCLQERSS